MLISSLTGFIVDQNGGFCTMEKNILYKAGGKMVWLLLYLDCSIGDKPAEYVWENTEPNMEDNVKKFLESPIWDDGKNLLASRKRYDVD